ncbi:tetratricopeptide repeat protein [Shimia marina]|uniref:Putative O-linked N-acetylglucosamine transferase, SPINDLY family n=1 Tax=Shimia marina TaxID=321267 RepID=A0A0P1ETB5_9RHOB|nr:tetratricopeptide repeat protein [Shimia marina]CUH53815.1 putative O-linked N-acetylglucosamine transferase, SPINDLY family [Shimia marina]SFE76729.1 Tetratricopeptide repeat-containing protein [Shimia marina]
MTLMKSALAVCLAATIAGPALSAGGGGETPKPKTVVCTDGKVFSESKGKCVVQQDSALTDEDYFKTLRSLAYAGENEAAQELLQLLNDPNSDLALTYWGFTHRRLGDVETGMAYYNKALQQNPDNILARSYMGQAFVEAGRLDLARTQLHEIRTRGGENTWAEASLSEAIKTGTTFNY